MAIIVKEIESKVMPKKKNITLKDIVPECIKLVDTDGEDLTQQFIDALPDGVNSVTLKVSFELES